MDTTIAGLIGVGIGAIASLVGSLLSNWLLIRRDREQWLRDQRTEHQRWLREKLQETYHYCIHYLSMYLSHYSEYVGVGENKSILPGDFRWGFINNYRESQKWLGLLLIYYPRRTASEFDRFRDEVTSFSFSQDKLPDTQIAKSLRDQVIELAARDSRLQSG